MFSYSSLKIIEYPVSVTMQKYISFQRVEDLTSVKNHSQCAMQPSTLHFFCLTLRIKDSGELSISVEEFKISLLMSNSTHE